MTSLELAIGGLFRPSHIEYGEAKIQEIENFDFNKATEKEKEKMEEYRERTWRKFKSNGQTWILNDDILNDIDKIFETTFQSDNRIDPKLLIGTHHPVYLDALKRYKTAIRKYFSEHIIPTRVEGKEYLVCCEMDAKLDWLFCNDHPERPPMPLFSRSVIVAIADTLSKTPRANMEVSSFFVRSKV
jgi:hypothetical protein